MKIKIADYSGIDIKTDQGHFGIAQRDSGIEVMLDGKLVWSSTSGEPEPKTLFVIFGMLNGCPTKIVEVFDDAMAMEKRRAKLIVLNPDHDFYVWKQGDGAYHDEFAGKEKEPTPVECAACGTEMKVFYSRHLYKGCVPICPKCWDDPPEKWKKHLEEWKEVHEEWEDKGAK